MQKAGVAHNLPVAKRQNVHADHATHRGLRWIVDDSIILCGLILFVTRPVNTNAADVELAPAERWSSAFGDEEIPIVMTVRCEDVVPGTVRWSHSVNNRTLDHGTVAVVEDDVPCGKAEFTLRPQPLRDGVILKTNLSTAFIPRGSGEAAASHDQTIWLFPRDPLAQRREWSAGLDIRLFDPQGRTAAVFEKFGLSYKLVDKLTELNDGDWDGIFIIGEGTSLRIRPSLADAAIELAASGRRVILLSPIDGSLALPGLDFRRQQAEIPVPTELRLAQHQVIAQFDKRLDHLAWRGTDNTVPARGLSMESRGGRLRSNISDDAQVWPFMELRYADQNGVLVMCGFEIIVNWDNGPTPRYLLIRLLEALSRPAPAPRSHSPLTQ